MINTHRLLASFVLILLHGSGSATQVYRSTAPDGSTVFSDQPSDQATPITIDPPPAPPLPPPSAAPPAAAAPRDEPAAADKPTTYKTLRITQPADDAVVWFAEGPVAVTVEIVPPLAEGHVLVPFLNGVAQGEGVAANGFSLTGLDPDTYRLAVAIHDETGKSLKTSPAIRFHFKRQSVNLPARRPPPRNAP